MTDDCFCTLFISQGLKNLLLVFAIFVLFIIIIYILFNTIASKLKVTRTSFYENMSQEDNLRCVFFSDLHINCLPADKEEIIRATAAEEPDFIIFSGDFSHSDKNKYSKEALAFFESLVNAAACPVYVTYGNHDVKDFLPDDTARNEFTAALQDISPRIRVLENESAMFTKDGKSILIGGLKDVSVNNADVISLCARWKEKAAEEGARFAVVSHNPDMILNLNNGFADFFLAGHTHAGQISMPFHAEFKVLRRHDKLACRGVYYGKNLVRETPVYITSGLGCSLLPIRFGTYPEIVSIDIGVDRH